MPKRLREVSISCSLPPQTADLHPVAEQPTAAHTPKYTQLDTPEPETWTIRCSLPPHQDIFFATYDELDAHYLGEHTNRCLECKANFPSAHFLSLHITENHDSITATKKARGEKTFTCFVESCDKVCSDWKKRRSHLVDKHGFPKNYNFLVVNHGIDGLKTMLRMGVDENGHRKSSRERPACAMSKEEAMNETADDVGEIGHVIQSPQSISKPGNESEPVDDITSSMSSLKMVPRSITFGRRPGRGLAFSKS